MLGHDRVGPGAEGRRWVTGRTALFVLLAILVLPSIGLLAVGHVTHDALRDRARTETGGTADQVAASVQQTFEFRQRLVTNLVSAPNLALGPDPGTGTSLADTLPAFVANGQFCDVFLRLPAGAVFQATGATPCPNGVSAALIPPTKTFTVLPLRTTDNVAWSGFEETIPDVHGSAPLVALFTVASLVGPLQARPGATVTVVTGQGIVSSTIPHPGTIHGLTPALEQTVGGGRAASFETYSPSLHTHTLDSYRPIAGTALGVVVTVRTSVAYADATRLSHDLAWGYGLFVVVALGVAFGVALSLKRREVARESAVRNVTSVAELSPDGIAVIDADGRLVYANPSMVAMVGLEDPQQFVGRRVEDWTETSPEEARAQRDPMIERGKSVSGLELHLRHVDGHRVPIEVNSAPYEIDGRTAMLSVVRDLTERHRADRALEAAVSRLVHQAGHDSLTGLANRSLFLEHLERALVRVKAGTVECALLFLDVDNFKQVNDTLGHQAGDQVLVAIGKRLAALMRPGDSLARLGGDEFVMLAEGLPAADALQMAERLRVAVNHPIALDVRDVTVTCSVGVAPSVYGHPDTLFQDADIALYRAKARGRDRCELYEVAMRASAQERANAEDLVRDAIEDHRLLVFYQPIVDLGTGQTVSTEALARIESAEGLLIGPDRFIPAAECSRLILALGADVLRQACVQQARWADAQAGLQRVSVNVSARQLHAENLVGEVCAALEAAGLNPDQLVLEVTESALIDAGSGVRRSVRQLRAMGVALALDDFGTGWSSLAHLRRFPFDYLKIDGSFVRGLGLDIEDTEVVRAIVSLGHALGLTVVAEGVETHDQVRHLSALGCDLAQGYLYGRPQPAEDVPTPGPVAGRGPVAPGPAAGRGPVAPGPAAGRGPVAPGPRMEPWGKDRRLTTT